MTSANSEPATARKTPRPIVAGGADNLSPPGNSPITPSSSQGFAISRWCDSHHPAYSASAAMNRTITPTAWLLARPTCLSRLGNELKARPHLGIGSGVPPAIGVSLAAPIPSGRDVKVRRAHVRPSEPGCSPEGVVVNGSPGQGIARGPAVRLDGGDRKSGCCISGSYLVSIRHVRLVVLIRMSSAFGVRSSGGLPS